MLKKQKCKTSKIGGQAVIEGVMMRGATVMATAVRDPKGEIQVESKRFKPLKERSVFFKIPIIRGAVALFVNMAEGMRTLTRASTVYGEIESKKSSNLIMFLGIILGVALAVGLFIIAPQQAAGAIANAANFSSISVPYLQQLTQSLVEGALRIAIFVGYLLLISLLRDIKRLFRYHGAEHKVINCYEKGLPITVENVQKSSRVHDRCGTTFIFLVMLVAIITFSFVPIFKEEGFDWIRMLVRLASLPLMAGVAYEILMFLAKFNNIFVKILKAPGLLMQKISTGEPDDQMVEVAIKAFNTVVEMQNDLTLPETQFVVASAEEDGAEPPQYKAGKACFYGYDFIVNKHVLIPRFDTEHLAEQAIIKAKSFENPRVLDLCTGSGAVAITIKKQVPNATVIGADVSLNALQVAKQNAKLNDVEVGFMLSNMFEELEEMGLKFDIIVSNPPYIPTADIKNLEPTVKNHEPRLALDGGADGLDFYRHIAEEYEKYLVAGGYLLLEVGIDQAEAVKEMFKRESETVKDYNDPPIERVLIFK